MKIGVLGFGHFAGVVSHCLAAKGHDVTAIDFTPPMFREDQRLPSQEPSWALNYTIGFDACFPADADVFWIAYDVPLDTSGAPVVDEILVRIKNLHEQTKPSMPFLVSCQWPVGTTRQIASLCEGREFVYVMENVRAGKAIADFQNQAAIIIGAKNADIGTDLEFLLNNFTDVVIGMSWESAEFGKHAMNAFLALQIAFVNELARIAPPDVSMADVTRVLKADARVSPHAPLLAGAPFGGGSLKRDLKVLEELTHDRDQFAPIIAAILSSNEA